MVQYIVIISFLITQAQKTIMTSLIFENIETKLILNTGYEMLGLIVGKSGKQFGALGTVHFLWHGVDCWVLRGTMQKKVQRGQGGGGGSEQPKNVKGVKGVTKNFAFTFGIDSIHNNANIMPECKN